MATNMKPADAPEHQPAREHRTVPLEDVEWRAEQNGRGADLTVRGHASVYDRLSLDLGGFRERIARDAFTNVLDRNPDVHALWDHDTKYVLARTKNKTLELREDPIGLHFWAKVADTSYAKDLRILMERGDVDQASFAFTVARDEWSIDDQDNVTRTILEVGELYDVTVTAQGAYPQSDASVVQRMRSRIEEEIEEGHLPEQAARAIPKVVAPDDPAGESEPQDNTLDSDEQRTPAPETVEDTSTQTVEETRDELKQLQAHTRTELQLAKRRLLDAERKKD